MNKHRIALALALACAGAGTASAGPLDFKLMMPGASPSHGNADQDIDGFLRTAGEAHLLTSRSAFALSQALLAKAAAQDAQDRLAAAKNIADPKEREAAMSKIEQDVQAQLAKVDYEAKANEIAKQNDARKNALVGAAMHNFVLGLLKDQELVARGSSLVSSAAGNPMLLARAGEIKDAVGLISGQLGNMTKIAAGLQKLSARIKSAPLPTSASAAPVAVAD